MRGQQKVDGGGFQVVKAGSDGYLYAQFESLKTLSGNREFRNLAMHSFTFDRPDRNQGKARLTMWSSP